MLLSPALQAFAADLRTLPVLQARFTLRLCEAGTLPAYKGALLRGGLGYAMQRVLCPRPCWAKAEACAVRTRCPYHRIFEAVPATGTEPLINLHDAPRAFVLSPPDDLQTQYSAGAALEFRLLLIGSGIDDLPHFILGFEQLGRMGLGRFHTPVRLDQVEVLAPWQAVGTLVYADGQARAGTQMLPYVDLPHIMQRAHALPGRLHLKLLTPLHLKQHGQPLRVFSLPALIQAIGRRASLLGQLYAQATEPFDYRHFIDQAHRVPVSNQRLRWDDWRRTSTRGEARHTMPMGGLVGSVILQQVAPELRAMLLLGSLIHAGKGATFGLGQIEVNTE